MIDPWVTRHTVDQNALHVHPQETTIIVEIDPRLGEAVPHLSISRAMHHLNRVVMNLNAPSRRHIVLEAQRIEVEISVEDIEADQDLRDLIPE